MARASDILKILQGTNWTRFEKSRRFRIITRLLECVDESSDEDDDEADKWILEKVHLHRKVKRHRKRRDNKTAKESCECDGTSGSSIETDYLVLHEWLSLGFLLV